MIGSVNAAIGTQHFSEGRQNINLAEIMPFQGVNENMDLIPACGFFIDDHEVFSLHPAESSGMDKPLYLQWFIPNRYPDSLR